MSQDISLIISKEIDLKIAPEIPHFINSGVLYIPISIFEGCEYGELIKESLNTNNFQILNYIDDYHFLKVANNIGVKNFIALHFSDYGTMPMYHYEFRIKAYCCGEILKSRYLYFQILPHARFFYRYLKVIIT